MNRASWSLSVTRRAVDASGTVHVEATLKDAGVDAGRLVLTLSAERHLHIEWHDAPGAAGLTGFSGWAKED